MQPFIMGSASSSRIGARLLRKKGRMVQLMAMALMILAAGPSLVSIAQDTASEESIRTIVAEQVAAWNAGDGQAYARHLAPDCPSKIFGRTCNDWS